VTNEDVESESSKPDQTTDSEASPSLNEDSNSSESSSEDVFSWIPFVIGGGGIIVAGLVWAGIAFARSRLN